MEERIQAGEPGANGNGSPVYQSFAAKLDAMSERGKGIGRQSKIVAEFIRERRRQDEKYPDETPGGDVSDDFMLSVVRGEFWEVVFAPDDANRREEVVQLGACCLKWIEVMDARRAG